MAHVVYMYLLIRVTIVFGPQTIALHIYNISYTSVEYGTEHASDLGMTLRDHPERWVPRCRRSWPPGQPGVKHETAYDPYGVGEVWRPRTAVTNAESARPTTARRTLFGSTRAPSSQHVLWQHLLLKHQPEASCLSMPANEEL